MSHTKDIFKLLDWTGFIPEEFRSTRYHYDRNREIPLVRFMKDADWFAPFITLQLLQINFPTMQEFGVKAEITAELDSLLGIKLQSLTAPFNEERIEEINELIAQAGQDFFSHCVDFDCEDNNYADLSSFLVNCQHFFRKNYIDNPTKSDLITNTDIINEIFRCYPAGVYKKTDLNFGTLLCKSDRKSSDIHISISPNKGVSDKNFFDNFDVFVNEEDEDELSNFEDWNFFQGTSIQHEDLDLEGIQELSSANLSSDLEQKLLVNNDNFSIGTQTLVQAIENVAPKDQLLTFNALAQSKDETVLCFLEKLCLIYKHPLINDKPVTETVMWAAIISSSKMRKKITSHTASGVDLLVTDCVMHVLKQVSKIVENRLYSEGPFENKNWFESDKFDVKKLKANEFVSRIISFIFQNEHADIALNELRLAQLFEIVRKVEEQSETKKIVQRLDNNRLELSKACEKIKNYLDEHIFGQEEAKQALINTFRLSRNGTPSNERGPVFLYGASGVGKTAVVKAFSEALNRIYEDNFEFQIFNMEQFTDEKDAALLLGSGHVYNGASLGLLTTPTEFIPNRIILFDEIEKTSGTVIQSLLSVLSARECQDRTTRRSIDFNQCIFVFTSNIASSNVHIAQQASHHSMLAEKFSPEFINRMMQGSVCRCVPLEKNERIKLITRAAEKIQKRQEITFSSHLPNALALMAGELSPRTIDGQANKLIALINSEEDRHILSSCLNEHNTHVEFSLSESNIDLDNLITRMRDLKWRANYKISSTLNDTNIQIKITISDATVEYKIEHKNCPFITFIDDHQASFEDIHGQQQIVDGLKKQVDTLNSIYSGAISKGHIEHTLLFGPSGSGKTMLGTAVSEYFKGTFIQVNSSDLTIGDTEDNIKKLFNIASQYSPCIIFIENIDAIAPVRKDTAARSTLSMSALQSAMDAIDRNRQNIWILATTTNHENIDSTMIRTGRISCKMHVTPPSLTELQCHISMLLAKRKFSALTDKKIQHLSHVLEGLSYRNINNILDSSFTKGCSSNHFYRVSLEKAINETVGPIQLKKINDDEHCRLVAYHEAGHVVVTALLYGWEKIIVVDINNRAECRGLVIDNISKQDKFLKKRYIKNHIQIFLAGRAAELLTTNDEDELSSGAASDITSATKLAYEAITRCGFSNNSSLADHRIFKMSDHDVKTEVDEWLKTAHTSVSHLLKQNWHMVNAIADALLYQKTIINEELLAIVEQAQTNPPNSKTCWH